jgi:hypothetical protein
MKYVMFVYLFIASFAIFKSFPLVTAALDTVWSVMQHAKLPAALFAVY